MPPPQTREAVPRRVPVAAGAGSDEWPPGTEADELCLREHVRLLAYAIPVRTRPQTGLQTPPAAVSALARVLCSCMARPGSTDYGLRVPGDSLNVSYDTESQVPGDSYVRSRGA